ncbi:immunoglobulin-like domain-containing protein [Gemella haemolysans]|uniref:immunoglobulin-like domain-containing protein n=1 Tax=Gemella haemolysans TaxID=1379 RepID=UPI0036F1EC16
MERRLERTFYFIIPENATIKVGEDLDLGKDGIIARKAGHSYLDDLIIEGEVDNTKPGTYELVYKVTIDNKEHKRKRLITVVDENV